MILQSGDPSYPIRHESFLAAGLLLIALLDMPYGYYQFLRWIIMIVGVSIAFSEIAKVHRWLFFFGLSVAALFNPFLKVAFGREIWWWTDLALACIFLVIGLAIRERPSDDDDGNLIEAVLDEND